MSTIDFEAELFRIGEWTILRLPPTASAKLPSRGMTMVEGTINDYWFKAPLEPDGKGSHWLRIDDTMLEAAGAEAGDTVMLEIEPAREWTEPELPEDLKSALEADPRTRALWMGCPTMARRDWIRWINATAQQQPRRRRIEVAFSKLNSGMRRPCCFNRSMCTEPSVSKNGVLLEPAGTTAAKAK
jgi:hypothetical protein